MKTLCCLFISVCCGFAACATPVKPDVPVVAPDKPPKDGEFEVTDKTDVRLDGKPCKLGDIPKTATLETFDVDSKTKVVLKMYFVSREK